jgi:ribosomal protein L11 methyltransferase
MNQEENSRGRLTITCEPQQSEAITQWIEQALHNTPVETKRPNSSIIQLDTYFQTQLHAEIALHALPAHLPLLHANATELPAEAWTTFWQHHFQTEEIGSQLRIVPHWETAPDDERHNLLINPGLSFGTGGHFTTRFCLEQLETAIKQQQPHSLIDAGTGSGILAIAAKKLGIQTIHAFDNDPIATQQAHANARLNNVPITFHTTDLLASNLILPTADLLCANILTGILLQAAPLLYRTAHQRLILSGIREIEADAVADTFIQLGAREIMRDGNGEWCGITLERDPPCI